MNKKISNLPKTIKVKINKGKLAKYIAVLTEYDVFTEADNIEELNFMINDLIFTYFDIPKTLRGNIWYRPKKEVVNKASYLPYHKLIQENYYHNYC
jgi:hypothetical protein